MIRIGSFKAGVYCGARWNSLDDWKFYGLRKLNGAFNIGPIIFWWKGR